MKKVYMSESVGPRSRGKLLGKWRDRAKEYIREMLPDREDWIKQGGSVWVGRGGGFSAVPSSSGTFPEGVRCQSYR